DDAKTAGQFLRTKVVPPKPVDKAQMLKLIADLNDPLFRVREVASKALAELGERAGPALQAAAKDPPSEEARRRVRALLDRLKREPSLAELRELRAIQALEFSGTSDARAVLAAWAVEASGMRLGRESRLALERLDKARR